jgi:DNA-binding transcriptional LysR family regulator
VVSRGGMGGRPAAPVSLAEALRGPYIRIDERDPLGTLLAEQAARLAIAPAGEIVVQTHHTALVLAEQGFGPAVIDSFTAAARRDPALVVQPIEPEVPVALLALQPQGVRSSRIGGAFIDAFARAVA